MVTSAEVTEHEQLRQIVQRSVQYGDFILSSGERSPYYFDGKKATHDPEALPRICRRILGEMEEAGLKVIGGPATGANPIVTGVQMLASLRGEEIAGFYVRPRAKEHGTKRLVEGNIPGPGAEVVVVDDTMTTGGSLRHAIDAVEAEECKVARVIVIVDRGQGGAEALRARGYQVSALFQADANGNLS